MWPLLQSRVYNGLYKSTGRPEWLHKNPLYDYRFMNSFPEKVIKYLTTRQHVNKQTDMSQNEWVFEQ